MPEVESKKIKRDVFLKVRCTLDEKMEWQHLARGYDQSLSELLREAMNRVRPFTPKNKKLIQERTRELAKIGNNINQLSRFANRHKSNAEAIQILEALMLLQKSITSEFSDAQ